MKHRFDSDCIACEEEGVDIEPERHRRVTKFVDAAHRVKSPSKSDLDDIGPERPDIADHVRHRDRSRRHDPVIGAALKRGSTPPPRNSRPGCYSPDVGTNAL